MEDKIGADVPEVSAAKANGSGEGETLLDDRVHNLKERRRRAVYRGMWKTLTKQGIINIIVIILVVVIAALFAIAASQEYIGNFTIMLSRIDMYRYGISLSEEPGFTVEESRLRAEALESATNISLYDLPDGLQNTDGRHNGANYIAYTFYVRNGGDKTLVYDYKLTVKKVTKNVDSAIRVAVWFNGQPRQIFALPAADGKPEGDTLTFVSDDIIDQAFIRNVRPKSYDKYTVVMWIEGDDPECTDELLGGMIQVGMNIDVVSASG